MELPFNDHLLQLDPGEAVRPGWPAALGGKPMGVTWHWTATRDLTACRRILGPGGLRAGAASAHFAVGRTRAEGIDRYVSLENRSWHAGVGQILRWDGEPATNATKGSRACIGIETVNPGFARPGVPAEASWIAVAGANGRHMLRVPPWPAPQVELMIALGRHIQRCWPHLRPEDHHGHSDLCPGYKEDVAGFPFAAVLRGIYEDPRIADVWTPYRLPAQRQQALIELGYDLGRYGADGDWGRLSDAALRAFQREHGLVENGFWTVFTARAVHRALGR